MIVASLHVYPVKSMRGHEVASAEVEPRGLRGDRRWMVVDPHGRFITARQQPRLLLISAERIADGLLLFAPDGGNHEVQEPAATRPVVDVGIWKGTGPGRIADDDSNAWLSRQLGIDARLVHMADDCVREVRDVGSVDGDIVSFADAFPLLLLGTASLAGLNAKLARPLTMANFRPNLVVRTEQPHVEDGWKRIRIGEVEFAVAKPCTRCVLTTIDPDSAVPAADGEPLATLKTYRREAIGVTFGQNLLVRGSGTIAAGMPIRIME